MDRPDRVENRFSVTSAEKLAERRAGAATCSATFFWQLSVGVTPLKTNMTGWKLPMFNRKYIFIHGGFPASHVSFFGGVSSEIVYMSYVAYVCHFSCLNLSHWKLQNPIYEVVGNLGCTEKISQASTVIVVLHIDFTDEAALNQVEILLMAEIRLTS